MNILLLTKKVPFPLKDGEAVAVDSLSRALGEKGHTIHLLSMNTSKHRVEIDEVREQMSQYSSVTTSAVDNTLKPWAAFANLFTDKSYHIDRFDYPDFRECLNEVLSERQIDIVLMESVYLTPYIDTIREVQPSVPIVMRAHNVEYEVWQRVSEQTRQPIKKAYLQLLVRRLKKYEQAQMNRLDGLITFTERDLEHFGTLGYPAGKGLVAPISIPVSRYGPSAMPQQMGSVGFIGSLDWQPNIEGLEWFFAQVWPLVLDALPAAKCHVAGRNPTASLLSLQISGVTIHGEVADAVRFVNGHDIAIAPLLSGGGMRVKILEAMALGRCVVSTSVGAEGIDTEGLIVADTAKIFAERLVECIQDSKLRKVKGAAARRTAETKYDLSNTTREIEHFLASKIKK